jgi:hypothetical protein
MDSQLALAGAPGQLLGAGPYDPATGKFMGGGRGGGRGGGGGGGGPTGFDLLFGTVEVMAELELVVEHPNYWEAWHQYAVRTVGQPMAYAAYVTKDAALGRQVAQTLIAASQHHEIRPGAFGVNFDVKPHRVTGPDVPSPVWELEGRPEAGPDAHRLLVLIESLDWAGEYLPKE